MRPLAISAALLLLLAACGEEETATLNEAEARLAMIKDRGLGYSDVCAAAAIDKSKKEACEKDMQAREAAFRFQLVECKPGAPEALKARAGALNEPMTCTVRWSKGLDQTKPLRSSQVLFHVIDQKLQAALINSAK